MCPHWKCTLKSEDSPMNHSRQFLLKKKPSFSYSTSIQSGNHSGSTFKMYLESWPLFITSILGPGPSHHYISPRLSLSPKVYSQSSSQSAHITPLLKTLHWMPTSLRVKATVPTMASRPCVIPQHPCPLYHDLFIVHPTPATLIFLFLGISLPSFRTWHWCSLSPWILFIQVSVWERSSFPSSFSLSLNCPWDLPWSPYLTLPTAHPWPIPLSPLIFFHRSHHLRIITYNLPMFIIFVLLPH